MARVFATGALLVLLAPGCGDRCERLCQRAAERIDNCKPDSLSWADLGARSRQRFADQCRDDWYRESTGMTANDLRIALEVCDDTLQELPMTCPEIVALYGVEE
jgi:hypothetical protein